MVSSPRAGRGRSAVVRGEWCAGRARPWQGPVPCGAGAVL